jgi:prepilin-type N-terminal cleavage/methylation domain-containing protein
VEAEMVRKRGITLVEILIVLSIVAILAKIGVPMFLRTKYNLELKSTARTVASSLLMAKTASFKGQAISVDFSDSRKIKICEDKEKDGICQDSDRILHVFDLSDNINLKVNRFVYFERGLPKVPGGAFGAGTIVLEQNKTHKCFEVVFSKTGRIKVSKMGEIINGECQI